jgi:transcriptional regulator with XRE-family HTH domain
MPNIFRNQTNSEVMLEIGRRLRDYRLQQNLAVADVAERAGINRNTVLNAEAGRNPRLETVLRLLRVYGRVESLDAFLPKPTLSPLQVVKNKGKLRRRARKSSDG